MRPLNLIFIIIFFLLVGTLHSSYAFFDKDVSLLTMQDGLADNTVTSIYKDKDGFMWFGTNNGLSRYDGKAFKNFSSEVSYMGVSEINELTGHCLGVLSNGSLYGFNRETETFIPVGLAVDSGRLRISHLLPVDENSFWALDGGKLMLYRQKEVCDRKGQITSIEIIMEKEYTALIGANENFSALCYTEDSQRICLVTNRGNLLLFDPASPHLCTPIRLGESDPISVNSVLNKYGIVWISTTEKGIIRYHLLSGKVDRITYGGKGKENLLSHTDAFQVVPIHNNRLLAATWSGYTLLIPDKENPEGLTTEIYNNTVSQLHRSLETRMISAYYDTNGIIWIGTNGGGVMYSDLRSQYYNQFHQEGHNEICGVVADSSHRIWLATFHQGIMRSDESFDPGKRLHFTTIGTESLRTRKTVLCAIKGSSGGLWFGNRDGSLTSYNEQQDRFTVYPLVVNGVANSSAVWALYMDRRGYFWVGTEYGLLLFDPQSGSCRRIDLEGGLGKESQIFIRTIVGTEDGTIWLGTSTHGICKLTFKKDGRVSVKTKYEERAGVAHHSVRSLLASSDGNIYIGYMNGFAILCPKTDAIKEFYTTHNGLCSNFIGCIAEDDKGRIWLGTNSGMSRYSRHQHLFYNYYIAGSNRSVLYADSTLFWGNNKSLTYFSPKYLDASLSNDKVLITALEVNNKLLGINEAMNGQTILQKGVSYTGSLVLANDNRDFALTFNNLSYSEDQQKYNYRLLPYQKDWLVSDDGKKASYTNLPEGDYTFEIKNIYPDGRSGEITSLPIKILPHWSHTLVFRVLVFLLFIGATAFLIRWVRLRQRRLERELQMKHELLTVNLEREKEHQIRLERENFFTSAAHELRTPLTLILSPLQELLQQIKPSELIYNKLLLMYKNGSSLHTLVDHLLYVQKIEAGMVKLRLSEVDIVGLVRDTADSFKQLAEMKGFGFEVELPEKPVLLSLDAEKIASSVKNLLSNAFKYTSDRGKITLSVGRVVKDGNKYCQITVSDRGIGIPHELQARIFDSFITGDNSPAFSTKVGIGLRIVKNTMDLHHGLVTLESAPGQGSTFVLSIPEGKTHFVNDVYETPDNQPESVSDKEEIMPYQPLSGQEAEASVGKKCLLIVEDNVGVSEYVRSLFYPKYEVLQAGNGEEGVRLATERVPDLIISDVMMPIKDGFTCCREIREQQETAHIPILMLTAKAEDADLLEGSRSGADDYMMKPFNPEILKAKVENLILQRERLKRIYTKALMLKQSESKEMKDEFMQKLINVVESNLSDENFNVKMLAEQLNMSQPTLYRKVKQRSELAVVDIIRSVRVSKAASLIMENRYSIQEISERVGFTDARTLRKHFTEQFGVPPSRYMVK